MGRTAAYLLFCAALLVASQQAAPAQGWDQVRSDRAYVWGEGWGRSVEEADREALTALGRSVSVAVRSSFSLTEEQRGGDYSSTALSSVSLRSFASLANSSRVVLSTGRRAHVGRWVRRDELERVLDGRATRVKEYEGLAKVAAEALRLDDALRYHYWAYALLRSLPRASELRDADGRMLVVSIPERINAILGGLTVGAVRRGSSLALTFRYRGRPVEGLDFTLFDGSGWTPPVHVRGGAAEVLLPPGALAEVVQLRVEYAYRDYSSTDDELGDVLAVSDIAPFRRSRITFRRKDTK